MYHPFVCYDHYSNELRTRLIKVVPPLPDKNIVQIPFEKYVLSNGLILIIHEDHSDPIVHVDATYHVGSAREEIGQSGFAHFFEHMMFQGSKHVADEEHFKIITSAGGTMNGTTNRDRTNYFQTVPSNYLETAIWLEADRMGFLLEAVTQIKFEVQRATVKNEKGQRYENRPYGMVGEIASKNFYPLGHPYSWPTIGYLEDLDRVGVEDLKKFFLRWYGPNNATITIGGDVNPQEVVKMVEKYFGSIPRGPEVEAQKPASFKLESDRYISIEDNIRFPMLRIMYPGVHTFHPDEAPLDILAEIIGQGKSSVLYQNFVKSGKALQASAYNPASELAGEFTFSILAYPGASLKDMEALWRTSLEEFEKRGITPEDLERAITSREASMIYGLESVSGKVSQLAMYEYMTGNADYIGQDLKRYKSVSKEDVMRVYETYVKGQKALYLSVYPKGQKTLILADDNYTAGGDTSKLVRNLQQYDTLELRLVTDNFDRSRKPVPGNSPTVTIPEHYTIQMPNMLKVAGITNNEVPDVYMHIAVNAGQVRQPAGKEGIAYLLASMLNESTAHHTAEAMQEELEKLGSQINIYSDEEDINITVRSLTRTLMPTMDLLTEILMHPKFDAEEFERVKKQQLELIANQKNQPEAMANEVFYGLLYGKGHPMGTPSLGSLQSVQSITLADVQEYFNQYFKPQNSILVMSGALEQGEARHNLSLLNSWQPGGGMPQAMPQTPPADASAMEDPLSLPETPDIEETRIYLVDKPGAPQSELRVGYIALPYDATGDFFKANIMNYVLGGAFNSRINLNLREDKGYTYGARSFFRGNRNAGPYVAYAGVKGDKTDSALYEMMKEINFYREKGITKSELEFTKASLLSREALKYETNSQKASVVHNILKYDLPSDAVAQQQQIIRKLKVKQLNKYAKKYLPTDKMVIVV
ncbi:MAG: insulinase family protein, partial [Bacteroidota bacterium]|nr:insulinase family protein [Bacteroidota bacterium]